MRGYPVVPGDMKSRRIAIAIGKPVVALPSQLHMSISIKSQLTYAATCANFDVACRAPKQNDGIY